MPASTERRLRSTATLSAAGVRFEFFDGICGQRAIELNLFERLRRKQFLLNTGRMMTTGEIGCFASHRALWALSVKTNESIMVMEDDFQLGDQFVDSLEIARDLINAAGYLRLQQSSNARRREIADFGHLQLSVYTKPPHCMMCYCISPSVAARFLELTSAMDAPVDVFVKKYWHHRQAIYALTPYSVSPSSTSAVSSIIGRAKIEKPTLIKLHRVFRKCKDHIQRIYFNWRHTNADQRSHFPL